MRLQDSKEDDVTLPSDSESIHSSVDDPDEIRFESLQREKHRNAVLEKEARVIGRSEFETIVRTFNPPRLKSTENVLKFWQDSKDLYPDLYPVAQIVLAVPGTEVSVERLFSQLRIILSPQRSRLNADIVNDILFLKSNYKHVVKD